MTTRTEFLTAFDRFKRSVDDGYEAVRQCLEVGDFVQAEAILAKIGQVHAKTSVSMRNYLIRNKLIEGDD